MGPERIGPAGPSRGTVLAVGAVLLSGLFARAPLVELPGGTAPDYAVLEIPGLYLVLAPICATFDALTLLTVPQHLALLGFVLALYGVARLALRPERPRSLVRAIIVEPLAAFAVVVAFFAVYAIGAFVPRPMASLRTLEPDALAVDFHSHTNRSHDGRGSFTAAANREWHESAGFDVAFVTDHRHTDSAMAAARRNPPLAGERTVLLPGLEFGSNRQHLVTLAPDTVGERSVRIQTLPGNLSNVSDGTVDDGVQGIELVDAAPRGLAQGDREAHLVLALADSLDLAVVASSNNHGWGRTAAAWSVMSVPGWRSMTPDSLAFAIADVIRAERRDAVRIVARPRIPEPATGVGLALTGPRFLVHLFRTSTWPERFVWIVWILLGGIVVGRVRPDRRPEVG